MKLNKPARLNLFENMKAQKHLHPESFMLVLVSVFLFLNIKASCQGEAYDQFAEIKAKKEQIPVWISELKKGHYIENLFFNEDVSLGLMDSLISRGQDNTHSIIKVPLLFRECVFESILDFSPESEKNIFSGKIIFESCTFNNGIIFSSSVFNDSIVFVNCEFNNELLDWFDGGSFEISSSNLKAPFIFYGNKIRCNFNLTNDTMNAVVMFANVNNTGSSVVPGNSYVLSEENNDFQFKVSIINCHFEKQLNFAGNTFNYDFQFKNSTCNDSVRFSSTSFNNNATFNYIKCRKYLTFNKSRMSKYVELLNLRGSGFMDFSGINFSKNYLPEKDIEEILDEFQLPEYVIGNTCFYIPDPDSVYLAKRIDSTLTKYPGLCYKSNFDENTTIALDENFIARQEIPIENIEKINFDFTNTSPDAPLGEQVHAMRELKRKILSQSDVLEEVRKGAAGKIDFIMAEYDRKNAKHWYDSAFLGFLFYTVNHGYKGGSQFFKLIFIVLFLFSLVYYLGFRKEVIGYIDEKTKKEGAMSDINDIHKKAKPTREFLLFFQSLWLSTVIFVNPRYPTDYFRFNDRMQVFIILEWIIGISMLAVYVIYIASNYGFIKSLVGI